MRLHLFNSAVIANSRMDYSPLSLSVKRSFEAEIVPLFSHCDEARTLTPHFYQCSSLVMASQKIYIKEKKYGW